MDIIQRNFLILLRSGAFGTDEPTEPMSAYKWQQLYRLSQIHGVTPWVADGIRLHHDDFFLQLPPDQRRIFADDRTPRTEQVGALHLTNPSLDRRLQQLAEEAGPEDVTFQMLRLLVAIGKNILSQGISLRQLIALGTKVRNADEGLFYDVLRKWIASLSMQRMVRLEGKLLVGLFHFSPEEILFADLRSMGDTRRVVQDMFRVTQQNAAEWYFTQGDSIFVRANNSGSMLFHLRHSARYMPYYPLEAVTNFATNFARSLTHIEE